MLSLNFDWTNIRTSKIHIYSLHIYEFWHDGIIMVQFTQNVQRINTVFYRS